nr:hypothetical protein [Tanacetum cinerariifolium]
AEMYNADTAEASNRRPHELSDSVSRHEQMSEVCRHCGALFGDEEDSQVLLEVHDLNITNVVQNSFGSRGCAIVHSGWKGTSWSFPRGKRNKDDMMLVLSKRN